MKRGVSLVVLDLVFVATELMFNLVRTDVHRDFDGGSFLKGDKIVLVFRGDQDFHSPRMLDLFDRDLDRH